MLEAILLLQVLILFSMFLIAWKIGNLTRKEGGIMAVIDDLKQDVADLQNSVTAESTVVDSAVTLLNGQTAKYDALNKELQDAIAANQAAANDPAIKAAADALVAMNQVIKLLQNSEDVDMRLGGIVGIVLMCVLAIGRRRG